MLWDGVNLFQHYATKPDDIEQGLQKCETECEGDYSLSGVSMQLSAWPRGDGCHKPDTTVRVMEKDKEKVWYSDELHKAFENSHEFATYSFDCVNGISVTSTAYNFFMTAQQDCFCPGIMAVAGRLSAAAENGIYVGARDLEVVTNIDRLPAEVAFAAVRHSGLCRVRLRRRRWKDIQIPADAEMLLVVISQ